ncbi:hypothetical protein [Dapis sp. BLCC M172]|uniref:hypothetical protein n=1 Tax=Dapis sp. BLCC M172 TaxID=2975281 RepID=UPI003CF99850
MENKKNFMQERSRSVADATSLLKRCWFWRSDRLFVVKTLVVEIWWWILKVRLGC